ncbi:glycine-rich domain-containing protein [Streptomyces sp. 7N604]|uniref:glycine-rich domain-containing protein n=1 Tax=Streptomyces sp. 7N604 TaxID=3457415 RepID=UPI003FD0E5FA
MSEEVAGRIVEEGIKFVVACSRFPDLALAPSRIVDEGWHALLLHSKLYADLCARFGEFVHHYPGCDPTHYDPPILERTRAVISELGYAADEGLWGSPDDKTLVSVAAVPARPGVPDPAHAEASVASGEWPDGLGAARLGWPHDRRRSPARREDASAVRPARRRGGGGPS